jgi:HlyD family secretion protein
MSPVSRGPIASPLRSLGMALLLTHAACSGGGDSKKGGKDAGQETVAVDIREVRRGQLRSPLTLVGTTQPVVQVAVRSRVEGHLETLAVDVGDAVKEGQELGRLDTALLDAAMREAEAGLAAARAQEASAQAGVAQAQSALEQSRLARSQSEVEAKRYASLAERGISSRQEAEQRAMAASTAQQAVEASTQQVRTQESLVRAASAQVTAQEALLAAARERRSFGSLRSPLTCLVVERLRAPGDLLQPGAEVLRVGDFSQVEVVLSVSELELSRVRAGRQVPVRLDAFGGTPFTGTVARISPQADPVSRLLPVEVVVDNPEGRIASGLLARVQLDTGGEERLLVLESALVVGRGGTQRGDPAEASRASADAGTPGAAPEEGRVFVVTGGSEGAEAQVEVRQVRVGERADGQVEILSGLQEGDRVVVRSQRPLKPGMAVRASALSDSGEGGRGGGGEP